MDMVAEMAEGSASSSSPSCEKVKLLACASILVVLAPVSAAIQDQVGAHAVAMAVTAWLCHTLLEETHEKRKSLHKGEVKAKR